MYQLEIPRAWTYQSSFYAFRPSRPPSVSSPPLVASPARPEEREREEGGRSSPQPFHLRWSRRPNHRRERGGIPLLNVAFCSLPASDGPPPWPQERGGRPLLTAAFRRTYLEAASSPSHLEGSTRPPARPCRRSVPQAPTAACRQREMGEKEKDREKWEKERRRKKKRGLTCEPHMSVGPTLFLSE